MHRFTKGNIAKAMDEIGVTYKSASPDFRSWLYNQYGGWNCVEDFSVAIPIEWIRVESGQAWLCYLASETDIIQISQRSPKSDLLPIGALMNGTLLVLDTHSQSDMEVGGVLQTRAMAGECAQLDRENYYSFNMSYGEWLNHIRRNPQDLRYL